MKTVDVNPYGVRTYGDRRPGAARIFEWNPNHACDLGTACGSSPLPLLTCSASGAVVNVFSFTLFCLAACLSLSSLKAASQPHRFYRLQIA